MLKKGLKSLGSFLGAIISEWSGDNVSRLSAAIGFYAVFTTAPLLVILIAVAGFVYGEQAVRGRIVNEIQAYIGPKGAEVVQGMIAGASKQSTGVWATILAFAALLFGASGFFIQLQGALNTVWGVQQKPGGSMVIGFLKNRLVSVIMVLLTGLLLIALMAGTSVIWTVTEYFHHLLPLTPVFWQVIDFLVVFVLLTLIFALVMRTVPDVKIRWRDVWMGALVTSILFTIGQFLLGLYLGRKSFTSSYGVAGSFVLILIWVYYSAQSFLIGAEMTQIYSRRYGKEIEPSDNAVRVRKQTGPPPEER
jgi:membrane protein